MALNFTVIQTVSSFRKVLFTPFQVITTSGKGRLIMSLTVTRRKAKGRKSGGKNRGYFYRKARGCWCITDGNSKPPLLDPNGNKFTAAKTPDYTLRAAWHEWRKKKDAELAAAAKLP